MEMHLVKKIDEVVPETERVEFMGIVFASDSMRRIKEIVEKFSLSDITILITGENGTGKELVARTIHKLSNRPSGKFMVGDCTLFERGRVESDLFGHTEGAYTGAKHSRRGSFCAADGGTLFLDEISSVSYELQGKLLRAIEQKEVKPMGSDVYTKVDVRIVAGSNQNLQGLVREGKFREDLFYRLNVLPINIPPLRDRPEDIPVLAEYFWKKFTSELDCAGGSYPYSVNGLLKREWRGNVRELENYIRRLAFCYANKIDHRYFEGDEDETPSVPQKDCGHLIHWRAEHFPSYDEGISEARRVLAFAACKKSKGGIKGAAKLLDMNRTTLSHILKTSAVLG